MLTTFCPCDNKDADQLCSNCTADQRLCFCFTDRSIHQLLKLSSVTVQAALCQSLGRFSHDGA